MIARSVNQAADVIHRAQVAGKQTAIGLAIALESAQLLQSPEAAHAMAELEAQRDALKARVVELEAQVQAARAAGELLSAAFVDRALEQLAVQPVSLEDPHDGPLSHRYELGRDLPPLDGVS